MRKPFVPIIVAMLCMLLAAVSAVHAEDSPHQSTLACTGCHYDELGNALDLYGVNNLCLSCHNPAKMSRSFSIKDIANPFGSTDLGAYTNDPVQSSHNWAAPLKVPAAGAQIPTQMVYPNIPSKASTAGVISCASCHDQHGDASKNPNLLRLPMAGDQLCFDCHRSRNTRDHMTGTHPVNFLYTDRKAGDYLATPVNANPANSTAAMKLSGGKIVCTTCHGVHFTDSNSTTFDSHSSSFLGLLKPSEGNLLRTDMRGATATSINICTNCHTGKLAHNNKGQNVQCADCHGGHVDAGDGTAPNVWLVRRYMNYSGGAKIDSYRRKVLNQDVGAQSNWAGPYGACQACHVVPAPGGSYPSEHASTNADVCRSCHTHNSANGSFAANCSGCHGFPPAKNVAGGPDGFAVNGSYRYDTSTAFKDESKTPHTAHAGKGVYTYSCNDCHAGNKHGTGNFQQVFLAGTPFGGVVPTYSAANGTCAVYCHSNGVPRGAGVTFKSVGWANGAGTIIGTGTECVACHDGVVGSINTLNTNVHRKHVSNDGVTGKGYSCSICHEATASSNTAISNPKNHVNGIKDVAFSGVAAGSTFNEADATCVTYCHSNGNGGAPLNTSFSWTMAPGTLGCAGCHGGSYTTAAPITTGKHTAHTNPTLSPTLGGMALACNECHAKTLASNTTFSNTANHVNGMKDYSGVRAGDYNATTKQCSNVYCHSNGKGGFANPAAWNSAVAYGCNGCHGTGNSLGAPDYANGGAGTANANSHNAHTAGYSDTGVCAACHYTTASSTGGQLASNTAHLNGAVNVVFNPAIAGANASYDSKTGTCSNIACHGNGSAQWGSKGGCLACHSFPVGKRAAIGSQFSANSHHVQGVSVSGEHCYECHWEANADGSINRSYHHSSVSGSPVELVIYGAGSRPTSYALGTTAVQYSANGSRTEMAKINAVCLGCHSDQNRNIQPFGDGKTPAAYAWDASSIDAKYSNSATTSWGKYTGTNITPKDKVNKALSAHGNVAANQGGWDTNETWTDRGATAQVLCFDCHNSHGSTVEGVTTSYPSATTNGGIFKDTTANLGGYAVSYKPKAGGSADEHNTYNPGAGLCFDCHMKSAATDTPWGYNTTYGSTKQIMGYWDSAYFGNSPFGKDSRYTYKAITPNVGGHFGASASLNSPAAHQIGGLCTPCHDPHGVSPTMGTNMKYAVPLLKGTWVTSPYKEDVAPADNKNYVASAAVGYTGEYEGPTRSQAVLDARKAAAKSFKIDQNTFSTTITNLNAAVAGVTETDAQFAGLCLNCHAKGNLSDGSNHTWKDKNRIHEAVKGWKTANGTIEHNYTCSKCHAPHNSSLPRLMVSNCFDPKHRGRVGNQASPVTSGSYNGSEGNGSGKIGGRYTANVGEGSRNSYNNYGSTSTSTYNNNYTCHENNDTTQKWNNVTQWTTATISGPTAPVLVTEPNATCSSACAVTLQWNASTNSGGAGIQYQVQVSSSSTFATINYTSGWISTTSYSPTLANGTWYWRVQARDSVATSKVSPWSTVGSFTISATVLSTTPTTPVLIPVSDSTCASTACGFTLSWNPSAISSGSIQYSVQVSASSSFSTIKASSGWISDTSYTPSLGTGTWYWRVQARSATSTTRVSAYSTVDSFVVSSAPPTPTAPSTPVVTAEADSTCTTGSCGIALAWSPSTATGGTVEYSVQVSNSSTFSTVAVDSGWITGTSYTANLGTGTWYWRVQARNSADASLVSSYSTVDSFVVSTQSTSTAAPSRPTLTAEPDGSCRTSSGCSIGLSWTAATITGGGTVEYLVQVSSSSTFSTIKTQSTWQTGTTWNATLPSGTWYWRVQARNASSGTVSSWSTVDSFRLSSY